MATITKMHIHYRLLPSVAESKRNEEGKIQIKVVEFSDPENLLRMKQEVAEALKTIRDSGKAKSYYLVAENANGGFRTISKKTAF